MICRPEQPSRFAIGAAVILATACIPARDGTSSSVLDFEDLPKLTLEEELRVGHVEDPKVGFAEVRSIRVAKDGTLFVLDGQYRQIRVFDPEGRPLFNIGQAGDGPGEFRYPFAMGLTGDTLWVDDLVTRRLTLFSTNGELLATVPHHPVRYEIGDPPVLLRATPSEPRPDGTLSGHFSLVLGPDIHPVRVPRLRFGYDGILIDTVGWQLFSISPPLVFRMGTITTHVPRPLADHPLTAGGLGPQRIVDRTASLSPDSAELAVIGTGEDLSDTVFVRRYRYQPIPLDRAHADSLTNAAVDYLVDQGWPMPTARRLIDEQMTLPEYLPPVSRAFVAADGSLWLRREEDRRADWRWTILDRDGGPIGSLRIARSEEVYFADGERLWVVHTDGFGVPWIVRYRIREAVN